MDPENSPVNIQNRYQYYGAKVVISQAGIVKIVCEGDCVQTRVQHDPLGQCDYPEECTRAHQNMAGSTVLNPKWCLYGISSRCNNVRCPFNHMLSEREFVKYRKNDRKWAVDNRELIDKYSESFAEEKLNRREMYRKKSITVGDFL